LGGASGCLTRLEVLPAGHEATAPAIVANSDFREGEMIDLYYWTTPNGHKITIFLEEASLPYSIKPVNISKGEQFAPESLAISPNNRSPAIVDLEPVTAKGH